MFCPPIEILILVPYTTTSHLRLQHRILPLSPTKSSLPRTQNEFLLRLGTDSVVIPNPPTSLPQWSNHARSCATSTACCRTVPGTTYRAEQSPCTTTRHHCHTLPSADGDMPGFIQRGLRHPIVPLPRQPWKTASLAAIGRHDSPPSGKVDFLE